MFRWIMSHPKEERQAIYDSIPNMTPEIKQELTSIQKLEAQGLNRKDRDLTIMPEEIRARAIFDRIMDLGKKNRQAKYNELLKMGIITPSMVPLIQKLQKEVK